MLPPNLLNVTVSIKRRASTGRDVLGNPIYGAPTSGIGWNTVYDGMPVRLAFSSKPIRFAAEGERVLPTGVMYYNLPYALQVEDRVITSDGIEYNVISVVPGYGAIATVIDHYEAVLQLP